MSVMIDSEKQVKRVEIIKHVKQKYKMLDTLHVHCTLYSYTNHKQTKL